MTRNLLPLVLLLLPALGGCAQPHAAGSQPTASAPPEPPITWGLGIATNHTWPPGPFQEGAQAVRELGQAINRTIPAVAAACDNPTLGPRLAEAMNSSRFLGAIFGLLDDCLPDAGLAATAQADATRQDPAAAARAYAKARGDAEEALRAQTALLAGLPPPATVLEAEVQAALMNHVAYLHLSLMTSEEAYGYYVQLHKRADLVEAFLNPLIAAGSSNATRAFVAGFPWSRAGACTAPSVPAWEARILANASLLLEEAGRWEPPSEGIPVGEVYGAVAKGVLGQFAYYRANHFWPGMLALWKTISWYHGALETHRTNHLPLPAESLFLVARHQALDRWLDSDELVAQLQYDFTYFQPPSPEPWPAREALAVDGMESGFAELDCTPRP
ncbi:MAG: hypothetical protein QOI63_596 [Thermoplasmata archaeon]|jgi:hypothetical protein|nr:hypothetical protein [Thermoplasmata archaeon]